MREVQVDAVVRETHGEADKEAGFIWIFYYCKGKGIQIPKPRNMLLETESELC